jgi:hypothetical protein
MIRKSGEPVFRKDALFKDESGAMRRTFRKSIPFIWALLIGTMAGAFVAGIALFAAHS